MDPLSLSLGIAGLLPLIAKAIKGAKDYRDAVISAKDSIAALISELEALQFNVQNLQGFLEGDTLNDSNLRFSQTSVLLSCSSTCEAKLQALCRKLGQQVEDSGRRRRFLWPLNEKEHQKTVQELRNFSQWMHFALSIDGCKLLSQTSDDVLRVLGHQLEQFRAIESLEKTTAQIYNTVHAQKLMIEDSRAQEIRTKTLDWISAVNYGQKHQTLKASRAENTGHWILRSPEYTRWRDGQGQDQSVVLWCTGIQGSGKTNLASIIIDDLLSRASSSVTSSPVAYFYFDHQDRNSQSSLMVFRSILRQFLDQLPTIPDFVSSVYNDTHLRGELDQFECERLITELVREIGNAHLVIDALDECSSEHRASILQTLRHLSQAQGLRLLVTSRPHSPDITAAFAHHAHLTISAQAEDIRAYIHQELDRNGIYDIADEQFIDELERTLISGADGMFLLPVLQLRTVLKEPTLGEMEDSLHNLSHSLSEAFGETIFRIQGLPASRSRIGIETLMYLAHAVRLLDIGELSELLAIHSGNYRGNNAKYRPSESMILQCCQGLITIDPTTLEVRVAHHSIQEFLLSNSNVLLSRATARFAVSCLRCLMSEDLRAGPWETKDEIELRLDDHPFSEYASWFWGKYAKETEQDLEVRAALTDFFSSPQAMATANQIRQYTIGYRREYWCPEESLSFTPLHFASRHGLTHTVAELLRDGAFDVNVQSKAGSTPIIQAASSNHVDIIQMLVKHGADPYLCNWYGNALHCAIEGGSAGAVRELIVGCGMDPNCCPAGYKPYLWCAIDNDSADVFELLVDLGVGKDTGTLEPLFLKACSYGCYRIVGRMIERGWADASDTSSDLGREGLRLAAGFRHLNIVKRLVEAGADVNNRDNGGVSALDLLRQHYPPSGLEFVFALSSGVKAAERTGNSPFSTKKERVPLDDCNPISGSQPL